MISAFNLDAFIDVFLIRIIRFEFHFFLGWPKRGCSDGRNVDETVGMA